jgi:predicted enzyme related to lactoylglutathione lyase
MNIFYNTIVFVKDIKKSKEFYQNVLRLKIIQEYDTIIFFENHFTIHCVKSILKTVYKEELPQSRSLQGQKNILIYFETDNLEEAYQNVVKTGCEVIHPIEEQEWGQKVFRFYDPDKHIVEIGAAMHLDRADFKK